MTLDKCSPAPRPRPKIFYDGGCPLCSREIAFYQRRQGATNIDWVDISHAPEGDIAPGLSKDRALARFHLLLPDGQLVSGGAAFAHLWAALPGFRPLGKAFLSRPLAGIIDRAYDLFLKIRPRLQRLVSCRASG
tara:strand:- start:120 stop:521 length:402 start_codon:yes stop_codon:yes gene_type:complete